MLHTKSPDSVCNINRCRRPLTTRAWVTSCLHACCEEDGSKYVHRTPAKCPACDTALSDSLDVIQIEVNPSEQFTSGFSPARSSMVLAGLKPEVICDVASRALAFWMHQVSEDRAYLGAAIARGERERQYLLRSQASIHQNIANWRKSVRGAYNRTPLA